MLLKDLNKLQWMEILMHRKGLKFKRNYSSGILLKTQLETKSFQQIQFLGTNQPQAQPKIKKIYVGSAESHLRKHLQVWEHVTHTRIKHVVTSSRMSLLPADTLISYQTHVKVTLPSFLSSNVLPADQQQSNSPSRLKHQKTIWKQ